MIKLLILSLIITACTNFSQQRKELYEKRKKQVQNMDRNSLIVFIQQQDQVILDLRQELKQKNKELDESLERVARMDSVKSPLQEEIDEYKSEISDLEKSRRDLETKVKELEWEVRDCENRNR